MSGKTLAHYELVEKIGQGGMGEVYRATDTRLGRSVALKILPANLAQQSKHRTRFEREAKTISSLSHPGICTLYDFGHHDGSPYLVMELLEGETLAKRVRRGPVAIEDALRWGAEIAEALDCAHTHSIVHRDLKPSNVMLTASGLKLLDFGLAKQVATTSDRVVAGKTVTKPLSEITLTEQGAILGTVPYMAPEQVEGRPADARTDIFALGAVLYEMLTGSQAFTGDSQVALVASIMEREPGPISAIVPQIPPALDHTVRTCLAKDPDERWQSARDVMRELRWIAEDRGNAIALADAPPTRKLQVRIAWSVAALALAVAASVGTWLVSAGRVPEQPTTRFTFEAPVWRNWVPAISPDGRKILYRSFVRGDRTNQFQIHFLDSLEPRKLPTDAYANVGFWSPDSRYVAYTTETELHRVSIDGGPPETICAVEGHSANGDWHANGTILFDGGTGGRPNIWKVDAHGGDAERAVPPPEAGGHHYPSFLPDGRRFLFVESGPVRADGHIDHRLLCGDLETGQTTDLGPIDSQAEYAEPGYLLYMRGSNLVARPFDANRIEFTGEPRSLAEIHAPSRREASFSVSSNGVLTYQLPHATTGRLLWLDRAGRSLGSIQTSGRIWGAPSLSPDERRLAVALNHSKNEDIWIHDFRRGIDTRFTVSPGMDIWPLWSQDGRWIDWAGAGKHGWQILRAATSGAGVIDTLATSDTIFELIPRAYSSDGGSLIVETRMEHAHRDIMVLDLAARGSLEPFVVTPFDEHSSALSPDGHWLAYVSDESGRDEVYVRRFPKGEGRWRISRSGGQSPHWRGDGRELVYCADEHLFAVDVDTSEEVVASIPRNLFELPETVHAPLFDLSSDGERTIWTGKADDRMTFVVVMNWAAEFE